jgi:pyruvate dehydrogenase E2 component (dihydrolipoamide acetyltransferase)
MFGTKTFNPIINQPNSAILGVAATVQTPVVIDGEIKIRPIMALCLTIDHRIIDGMNGAKFMVDLKNCWKRCRKQTSCSSTCRAR